jgi:P-type E1-E2 ATPase
MGIALQTVTGVEEKIGSGVTASLGKKHLIVGKYAFLHEAGITMPSGKQLGDAEGETAIFVALDKEYIGAVTFSDSLRAETTDTIKRLKRDHVRNMMMLTGDKRSVAERIAQQVGITHVEAELLPADKLSALKRFRKRHSPLAFVGDGINDAPSLAAADVGIALGAKGSTAASETADVVIMLDDFSKVADSVHISHRSIVIAKQSIFVGIGLSIALMILAGVTGVIKPVYGAMLQEVVDIIVILNALRAHQDKY